MLVNPNDLGTQLLYSTIQIISFIESDAVKTGTGVIINMSSQEKNTTIPILVTNRHVINDSKNIIIDLHQAEEGRISENHIKVEYKSSDFICDDELDIAILPLAPVLNLAITQNKNPFFKSIGEEIFLDEKKQERLSAIEEIIFIGYPKGISDTRTKLPIVRKGITATPIWNNFNNSPEFLVDAETFEGSSGSPVFIYNNGGYFSNGGMVVGVRIIFLGIISKTIKDSNDAYLGLGHVINAMSILKFIKKNIKI